jgi:predicted Zn-dependent peptidase
VKFAVLGGSSAETSSQQGSAQFLAASAFTGNKQDSGLKIVRFLESQGAKFSATADRQKVIAFLF